MAVDRRHREDGYVLFGIVVTLIIMGIFLAAAVPLWQKIAQREKEQELIWRGYQYMDAIERYQRKYPGAFPPNVEVLVEQKFLRQAYEDPMSEDGEWKVLRQLSPELQPGGQQREQEGSGITGLNRSQARMRRPGAQPSGAARAGAFRSATGQRFGSRSGGSDDVGMGGIVGVASKSEEETFYQVPGKEKYKDWLFVFGARAGGPGAAVPGAGPMPGVPGAPGTPGTPGTPGGAHPGRAPGNAPRVAPAGVGGLGGLGGATLPPPPGDMRFRMGPQQPGAAPGRAPGQNPGLTPRPGGGGFGQPPGGSGFGNPPGASPLPSNFPPGQDPRRRQGQRPPPLDR